MKRAPDNLEFSIRGDEQEHRRIMLEHNLQHTDLSLHLSSNTPDDYHSTEDYSIEYPRHHSGPSPLSAFVSFEHPSRDDFDPTNHSQMNPWSFTDDEGIHQYSAGTYSTAAHHASALTLSAGLAGRGARRDVSLSGVEYDPDRPIHDMIAALDSRMSVFDTDPSRSKIAASTVNFDPLVVDDTAELIRVVDSSANAIPRPKLSDHLTHISFSPKRPRSAQSLSSDSSLRSRSSQPYTRSHFNTQRSTDEQPPPIQHPERHSSSALAHNDYVESTRPTPKASAKSRSSRPIHSSDQRTRPDTPSTAKSQFTRLAKGLAKEIEQEQSRWETAGAGTSNVAGPSSNYPYTTAPQGTVHDRRSKKNAPERSAFRDIVNLPFPNSKSVPRSADLLEASNTFRGTVHLPDVTGLTSAVASPAKAGLEYYGYQANHEVAAEAEARLIAVLNNLQSKLQHLETENGVSRRRVRELELELELCRKEVARERTLVLEETTRQQQQKKGKAKATAARQDISATIDCQEAHERRFKQVTEEKKALEALISTLRTHLARLTTELSSHQQLLSELRSLRESDARTMKEKSDEVDRLREEVERLAGEVEVLRGVVEEGLKERRTVKAQVSLSYLTEEPNEENEESIRQDSHHSDGGDSVRNESLEEVEPRDAEDEVKAEASLDGSYSSLPDRRQDRAAFTDRATLGSSQPVDPSTRRFVDAWEVEHISADLDERRSDRIPSPLSSSVSRMRSELSHSHSRSPSPSQSHSRSFRSSSRDSANSQAHDSGLGDEATSGNITSPSIALQRQSHGMAPVAGPSRPAAPTPAHAAGRRVRNSNRPTARDQRPTSPIDATPFPTIRGANLERIFFSAPEHNAKTCRVCHRRRRSGSPLLRHPSFPIPKVDHHQKRDFSHDDDDEGFVEGSNELDTDALRYKNNSERRKGKQRSDGIDDELVDSPSLPPQTVLARVVRELEDDFTHYKGIYTELADQYKLMDAASDVAKRNVLAEHLREVIDILEQKGDQIASLYDLLTFKDKPVSEPIAAQKPRPRAAVPTSGTDYLGKARGHRKPPIFA